MAFWYTGTTRTLKPIYVVECRAKNELRPAHEDLEEMSDNLPSTQFVD